MPRFFPFRPSQFSSKRLTCRTPLPYPIQIGVIGVALALFAPENASAQPLQSAKSRVAIASPRGVNLKSATKTAAPKATAPRVGSFLSPGLLASGAQSASAQASQKIVKSGIEARILPGLKLKTALSAPLALASGEKAALTTSQTGLSYDLGRLTLRADKSRLNWQGAGNLDSPLLGASLFSGARGASATGGGVDLSLGDLKFSTDIERLRADTGVLGSRIGGGASLSAFRDRLSLGMSLSRLVPGDKTAPSETAAQASASLDVSPRLSLNLKYQGLFAPVPSANASRVAGGVSLSF